MEVHLKLLVAILILQGCVAPPVTKNKSSDTNAKENEINAQETGLVSIIASK